MQYSYEDVISYIEDEDVKFVRLAFRDAYGVQKNLSILSSEISKAFKEGIPVSAKEIAGFFDCQNGKRCERKCRSSFNV